MLGSLLGQTSTFPCDECVENLIKVEYLLKCCVGTAMRSLDR